jgi:hypothetical protein
VGVTDTASGLLASLRAEIEQSGYYPALVFDSLSSAIGAEAIDAYVVHHDATFDRDELRRHMSALVLTPTRLVVGHTDEYPADEKSPVPYATAATEAVGLDSINSIVVSRTVGEPAAYQSGARPIEAMLTIGWGAVSRVELEPAGCGDLACEADHGFTGAITSDDVSLRVSQAGDGEAVVDRLLTFAQALSAATGR